MKLVSSLYRPLVLCVLCLGFVFLSHNQASAQCANNNIFEDNLGAPPCNSTPSSYSIGAGTYVNFTVVQGATYEFGTCGSAWNTQLTGYAGAASTVEFYNDNAGGACTSCQSNPATCTGTGPSFATWTSGFSGTLRVVVDRSNCLSCAGGPSGNDCVSYGSVNLTYRQVDNLNFNSSAANICVGTSRTLSASPSGGTFSGTGVSGTTFTPASAGSYTITYTLGQCSETQTITAVANSVASSSISSSNGTSICVGESTVLTRVGGTLGGGGQWTWYTGSCGSGSPFAQGSAITSVTVTPTVTTTYFVRPESACPASPVGCASITINVQQNSTAPTGINSSNNNFCPGGSTTLSVQGGSLAAGAQWVWYSGAVCCTSPIGTGPSLVRSPTATTTYYVRAESSCDTTAAATTTVTVNTVSTDPTGIISSNGTIFCSGSASTTLTRQGGSLGTNATWEWYSGSCGGTAVGSGTSIGVNPTVTTTYYVRADNGDCGPSNCASITINVSVGLAISNISKTDPLCNGGNTGSATVTATGGISPYSYSWSPGGGNTATINNLSAGTYNVTVTDNAGCTVSSSTTLVNPSAISVSASSTNVSCNGGGNGTITITASGGTGTLFYSIDSLQSFQSNPNYTGLAPGTYYVFVQDANNCIQGYSNNPITIAQPSALNIFVNNVTDASCTGVNNGSVSVAAAGGTPGYQYSLNGSAFQPGGTFTSLPAGTFDFIVEDAAGCRDTTTATVNNTTTLVLTVDSTKNISCNGDNDGYFEVSASNGTAPYEYTINNITYQSSGVFSGLSGGSYTVLARDAVGCSANVTINITEPAPLVAVVDSVTHIACNGQLDGDIFISVTGGTQGTFSSGGGTQFNAFPGNQISGTTVGGPTFSTLSGGANSGRPFASGGCCSSNNPPTDIVEFQVDVTGTYSILATWASHDGFLLLYTDPLDWTVSPPVTYVAGDDDGPGGLSDSEIAGVTLTAGQTYYLVHTGFGSSASGSYTTQFTGPGNAGTVTIIPGSTTAYQFLWSNGATTEDITGVAAGTYTVTVTDTNGCSVTASATINQPLALNITLADSSQVSCNGGNDGEIDITVTGGVPPYDFVWSNGTTTEDNIGLTAGTYDVTLTDDNGCTVTESFTINEPGPTAATAAITNPTCAGVPDGEIALTVTGGTPPYNYLWSNGGTTATITGLAPGTYSVQVRDSRNCLFIGSYTVGSGAQLTATIDSIVEPTCFGDTTGGAYITVSGGITGFNPFSGQQVSTSSLTGPSWSALSGGTLSGRPFDDGTCCSGLNTSGPTDLLTFTVDVTGTYTINSTQTGWDGYIHLFTDPLNIATISTFIDGNDDCTGIGTSCVTATLTAGQTYYLYTSGFDNTDNGPFTTSFSGPGNAGVGNVSSNPYTYNWSNGDTTEDLTGVPAGTYTVTVTDGFCTVTETVTITQPDELVLTTTSTNVLCNGDTTGAIDLTVTGGSLDGTLVPSTTTQIIVNITTDLFEFETSWEITDAGGGTTYASGAPTTSSSLNSDTVTVPANTPLDFTIFDSYGDGICCVWGNGSYEVIDNGTVVASGGSFGFDETTTFTSSVQFTIAPSQGYQYIWSTGDTTQDLNNLGAGTYDVTVSDDRGCTATTSVTITEPTAIVTQATVTDVTCNGLSNGSISTNTSGGVIPYTYAWSHGPTTPNVVGLAAGTYDLTVTDANGCIDTTSYTILEPPVLQATVTGTNVSCFGGNDGTASVTASGGTPPYSYLWSNFSSGTSISGLSAGTYTVVVTDANGCTTNGSYTVTEPGPIVASETITNVSCFGGNDGEISVALSGGTPPFNVAWSNGPSSTSTTSTTNSNLVAGTYTLTITDQNNCQLVETYTVTEPSQIVASAVATDVDCNGATTGAVDLTVSGGTPPYTYSWNPGGAATQDLTGVGAGTYTVTVTDDNGCTTTETATVNEPDAITVQGSQIDVSCFGNSDGSIYLTVTGGTPGFTYNWSNGATTQNLTNIAAGDYLVTVTDAAGCTELDTFTVNEPDTLTASIAGTNVDCFGASTGAATLTVVGGTAPYTYLWSNFATTQSLTNVPAGSYTVVVTDNNGCVATDTVTITQNDPIEVTGTVTDVTCFGDTDGAIDISVTGGVGPFSFAWSPGAATSEDTTGLLAGTYEVTVTDDLGCTASATFTVNQPDSLDISGTTTPVTCNGDADGAIDITVTGGTMPYGYLWNTGDTTADISGLVGGTYTVTVTDDNGCSKIDSFTVAEPDTFATTVTGNSITCFGFANGSASVTVTGGNPPYTYFWSNFRFTQNVYNLDEGWYFVLITDAKGCSTVDSILISEPNPLAIDGFIKESGCVGENKGIVDITVTGGTPPYTYNWSTGDTTEDIDSLDAGIYTVTVTDANGCVETFTGEVVSFPKPVADFTSNLACLGQPTQFVNNSTITNGTLTYEWDFGDGTGIDTTENPEHVFTTAGSINVTLYAISDKGCRDTLIQTIFVNNVPDASIYANGDTIDICAADSVNLSVTSGNNLMYMWSTGDTSSAITVFQSGVYYVTVINAVGCSSSDSIDVGVYASSSVVLTPGDTTISKGFGLQLEVTGGIEFEWSPTEGLSDATIANPIATPLENTTYTVTVTVSEGCFAVRDITINVVEDFLVIPPNVFSPNGDGIHDTWVIENILTYPICEVFIFNRWGSEVYYTTDYQNDWRGTSDGGDDLPDGTYYYILKCADKTYKGAITILR